MCYVGQDEIYQKGSESIEKFLRISMNKKQVERVSKYYGAAIGEISLAEQKVALPQVEKVEETVYCMLDGSMIYTRVADWKEVKLGRIFKSKALYSLSPSRNWIKDSIYVGHVGKHDEFLEKLSYYTDQYDKRLVFVCDGATWIWNWVVANYPKAVQILDYYHAIQHLSQFAVLFFKKEQTKSDWIEKQKKLLWESKVEQVIENIEKLSTHSQKTKEEQRKLINYYTKNSERMRYGEFKKKGYLIGSGPIESAHRTVIQKRMKLSGQRWTIQGAQNILDLRTANLNDNWGQVIDLIDGKIAA